MFNWLALKFVARKTRQQATWIRQALPAPLGEDIDCPIPELLTLALMALEHFWPRPRPHALTNHVTRQGSCAGNAKKKEPVL